MATEFTLDDLVNISGLTIRTIRFYIQEGLLDGPDARGRFSIYSQRHLDRIEVIKLLKGFRLPLHEIRDLLSSMTPDEIKQIYNPKSGLYKSEVKPTPVSNAGLKALEYIRNLEDIQKKIQIKNDTATSEDLVDDQKNSEIGRGQIAINGEQQKWRRIIIHEGIELHLLEAKLLENDEKITGLIAFLNQLFDDKPQKGRRDETKK
ncbi:MAG: MerR family transcriptional regulator [Anaerolineaceae bacterium]|nr:MerR family transcriptional regulator [Anaerolineaceae bacterium]